MSPESDRISTTTIRERLRAVARSAGSAWRYLGWVYVACALYLIVGTFSFPAWWHRFVFGGGVTDRRLWSATVQYVIETITQQYPIAFVLVATVISTFVWLVYRAGQVGIGNALRGVAAPSPRVTLGITGVLALALLGLAFVQTPFRTTDDMLDELRHSSEGLVSVSARWLVEHRTQPPESGFFLYLNTGELSRVYSALQKDLTMALESTTTEKQDEKSASISLKAVSGEVIARDKAQRSVQLVPTTPTPEREAVWLIRTYNELGLSFDVVIDAFVDSSSDYVLKLLKERGVELTGSQRDALLDGEARLLFTKASRTNVPLIYAGKLRLERDAKGFKFMFRTGDKISVSVSGTGALSHLEPSAYDCVKQIDGCTLDAKLLAIVWRTEQNGRSITLQTIPLAIW